MKQFVHASRSTKTPMRFSVFVPEAAAASPAPVLYWLSGLTCTDENFTQKAGEGTRGGKSQHHLGGTRHVASPDEWASSVRRESCYDLGAGRIHVDATVSLGMMGDTTCIPVNTELPNVIQTHWRAVPGVAQSLTPRVVTGRSAFKAEIPGCLNQFQRLP